MRIGQQVVDAVKELDEVAVSALIGFDIAGNSGVVMLGIEHAADNVIVGWTEKRANLRWSELLASNRNECIVE